MKNYVINFMTYPFLDYAYESGVELSDFVEDIEHFRQNPEEYANSSLFWRLIEKIEGHSNRVSYSSLLCAGKRTATSYGFTSDLFKLEANLQEAYRLVCRYLPIKTDLVHFSFHEKRTECEISLILNCEESRGGRFLREFIFAAEMNYLRNQGIYRQPFKAIYFSHSIKPGRRREVYEQYFDCPVYFDQPRTSMIIDNQTRVVSTHGYDEEIKHYLIEKAERKLLAFHNRTPLIETVRRIICDRLSYGSVRVETVAQQLGVTEKSLQRSMKAKGTSFTRVYNDVRMECLLDYIQKGKALQEIALLLGFSDYRALNHWFKRLRGISPSEYREFIGSQRI